MSDHASDGQMDRLLKARWLAVGLSQSDLVEVLGAAIMPAGEDDGRSGGLDPSRMTEIAAALELPVDPLEHDGAASRRSPGQQFDPLQALQDLRLLRAFRNLEDLRTRRLLVQLAELLVKRQLHRGNRSG
jgi:hypothetical protein